MAQIISISPDKTWIDNTILGYLLSSDTDMCFVGRDAEKIEESDVKLNASDQDVRNSIAGLLDLDIIRTPLGIDNICIAEDNYVQKNSNWKVIPDANARDRMIYAFRQSAPAYLQILTSMTHEIKPDYNLNFIARTCYRNLDDPIIADSDHSCKFAQDDGQSLICHIGDDIEEYLLVATGNRIHVLGHKNDDGLHILIGNKFKHYFDRFDQAKEEGLFSTISISIMEQFVGKDYDRIHHFTVE